MFSISGTVKQGMKARDIDTIGNREIKDLQKPQDERLHNQKKVDMYVAHLCTLFLTIILFPMLISQHIISS